MCNHFRFFVSVSSYAGNYKKLVWDRFGGGQIHFEVTPPSRSGSPFVIHLESAEYRKINEKSYLSHKQDPELYEFLNDVFAGKTDIIYRPRKSNPSKSSQPEAPTGTWTSIFLVDSESKKHYV